MSDIGSASSEFIQAGRELGPVYKAFQPNFDHPHRALTESVGDLWKMPPYAHETLIVQAALKLATIKDSELNSSFVDDYVRLLDWVNSLDSKQAKVDFANKRIVDPVLLAVNVKSQLDVDIKQLSDKFCDKPDWKPEIKKISRKYVRSLSNAGLLDWDKFMQFKPQIEKSAM